MKTRGEHIAEAIREYLTGNKLKQSHLTGAAVADIADRVLKHLDQLAKKQKRLASENDWIAELETEPHLAAVNVRHELAAAQFWCKNNSRVCTRRFFVNWLNKAERDVVLSPGGAKPRGQAVFAPGAPGWLAKLNSQFPGCVYAAGGVSEITAETDYQWGRLPLEIREQLNSNSVS